MKTKDPILNMAVTNLDVSNEFKDMCNANKFNTLAEITSYSTSELLKKKGFNMHTMMELIDILDKYNLGRILKEDNSEI